MSRQARPHIPSSVAPAARNPARKIQACSSESMRTGTVRSGLIRVITTRRLPSRPTASVQRLRSVSPVPPRPAPGPNFGTRWGPARPALTGAPGGRGCAGDRPSPRCAGGRGGALVLRFPVSRAWDSDSPRRVTGPALETERAGRTGSGAGQRTGDDTSCRDAAPAAGPVTRPGDPAARTGCEDQAQPNLAPRRSHDIGSGWPKHRASRRAARPDYG
jgi:hypothetical protein